MTPFLLWTGGAIALAVLAIALQRLPGRSVAALLLLAASAALAIARQFALAVPLAFAGVSLWRGGGPRARSNPSPGKVSEVRTDWLDMALDHDSGAMDGAVLMGRFAGRVLSGLSDTELGALRREVVEAGSAESRTVLDAYFERHRSQAGPDPDAGARQQDSGGVEMTAEEAYRILGLNPGASVEEVREAYHRLIRKVHPDTGGSSALAVLINTARARLDPGG